MSEPKKDKEDKKPLDMTTEEAMNFLFPKEIIDHLSEVANPPKEVLNTTKTDVLERNGNSYEQE
jgi:hypothetical protein